MLNEIFNKQKELIEKFEPIEEKNNCLPFDHIDSFQGQARLRNGAWRTTEEIGEFLDAYPHPNLYKSELSDVLHFLVEFTIISQHSHIILTHSLDNLYESVYGESHYQDYFLRSHNEQENYEIITFAAGRFIEALAMTVNTLKNKPWKQKIRQTDIPLFSTRLEQTWHRFIEICIILNIQPSELYHLYMAKHQINQNRIKAGE